MNRFVNNRITRRLSRSAVRAMAQHPISLTMMNRIYVHLSYRQKSVIHEHFARIFRGANGRVPSGGWMVRFLRH
jgi:hypothetical protein